MPLAKRMDDTRALCPTPAQLAPCVWSPATACRAEAPRVTADCLAHASTRQAKSVELDADFAHAEADGPARPSRIAAAAGATGRANPMKAVSQVST